MVSASAALFFEQALQRIDVADHSEQLLAGGNGAQHLGNRFIGGLDVAVVRLREFPGSQHRRDGVFAPPVLAAVLRPGDDALKHTGAWSQVAGERGLTGGAQQEVPGSHRGVGDDNQ